MNAGSYVAGLIADQTAGWEEAVRRARPLGPARELWIGSGSSYYVALAGAAVARREGFAVDAMPAADVCLEPGYALDGVARLTVVSRSGATSEALWAARNARARGVPVSALTADPASELAALADDAVASDVWEDQTVVMIRSFTSFLVYLQARAALARGGDAARAVESLPEHFEAAYQAAEPLVRALAPRAPRRMVWLGGGERFGVALEAMLKCTEMSHVATTAYHPLEYRHGPRGALATEDVVVLLGRSAFAAEEADVLRDIAPQAGLVAVVGTPAWFERAGRPLPGLAVVLPAAEDRWAGPLHAVAAQRAAWQVALAAGQDPDHPAHLDKVVRLRHA